MKKINIQSLVSAKSTLKDEVFKSYLEYYEITIKNSEIEDLAFFTQSLNNENSYIALLDKFYVGFKIPQIDKEFDLLRFGSEYILNIEIKSKSTEEKIKAQLLRNKYYLNFTKQKCFYFTFVSSEDDLFILNENDELEKSNFQYLVEILTGQNVNEKVDPNTLFDPSNYLISPFNATDRFLNEKYFLTKQQEKIKNEILNQLDSHIEFKFISIEGRAGTGKTLLTYDVAKSILGRGEKALIIHCGQLNQGHEELIKNNWSILTVKHIGSYDFKKYTLIIVDEAQRIYSEQLEKIILEVKLANNICIFSHDERQTLSVYEKNRNSSKKINQIPAVVRYKLTEKIRTNREIATFISLLFNNKKSVPMPPNKNIEVTYVDTSENAKKHFIHLDENGWKVLKFTPSAYKAEYHENYSELFNITSHQIIGQEFDKVAVVIDKFFSYHENGVLIYNDKTYNDMPMMLFQNLTRARKKLNVIIIGNEQLLERCIAILK